MKGKHITGSPFSINVVSSERQRRGSNDSTTTISTTNLLNVNNNNNNNNNTTPDHNPKSPVTNDRSPSHGKQQQQYNYSKPLSLEITNDYNNYRRQDSNDLQNNIYATTTTNNNTNDNKSTIASHYQYIDQSKNIATSNNTHDTSLESYKNLLLNTAELSAKYIFSIGHRGTGVGDFHGVFGVATDHSNRRIIATDCHNNRIQVFSEEGKFLFMFGQKGNNDGEFQNPTGVGIGPNGEIVVCERLKGRIQVTKNS